MTTYADCQTQVQTLLNRRDASTAQIAAWVQNSIQRIQRELRCPAMEKTVAITIDSTYASNGGLLIPTDMIELIDILNSQGVRIKKEDITTVLQAAKLTDVPEVYYRKGGLWILGPVPVIGDTLDLVYYGELSPLINPTDTNPITIIATDLVAYGALGYAADFFTDRRADKWEARFQQIIQDLQEQADDDELSGSAGVTPSFFYPDDLDGGGNVFAE